MNKKIASAVFLRAVKLPRLPVINPPEEQGSGNNLDFSNKDNSQYIALT